MSTCAYLLYVYVQMAAQHRGCNVCLQALITADIPSISFPPLDGLKLYVSSYDRPKSVDLFGVEIAVPAGLSFAWVHREKRRLNLILNPALTWRCLGLTVTLHRHRDRRGKSRSQSSSGSALQTSLSWLPGSRVRTISILDMALGVYNELTSNLLCSPVLAVLVS